MKRLIAMYTISIILIGLATTEVILVKNVNDNLLDSVNHLHELTLENKDNIINILTEVDNVKNDWDQKEPTLCLMFNHKDLSTVTDTLALYRAYVSNNDYDNAIAEICLLKEYAEKNDHVMGFNFQNLL